MRLTVELEGREPFDVETRPIDNVRYEDTARRKKWGVLQENPMRYLYFLAFAASQRIDAWPKESGFDAYLEQLVDVQPEDEDGAETPTPPGPGPG
jgi:hypothetical protein